MHFFNFQMTSLDLRQIEDIVDQRKQVLTAVMNRFDKVFSFRFVTIVGPSPQKLCKSKNSVQRRADLMTHISKPFTLRRVGSFSRITCFFEFHICLPNDIFPCLNLVKHIIKGFV